MTDQIKNEPNPVTRDKPTSMLSDPNFCRSLLAVVVMWNEGQPVSFTQEDLDAVAGKMLLEGTIMTEAGPQFCITVATKEETEGAGMPIIPMYRGRVQ
jgi:hypothetical protein